MSDGDKKFLIDMIGRMEEFVSLLKRRIELDIPEDKIHSNQMKMLELCEQASWMYAMVSAEWFDKLVVEPANQELPKN